MITDKAINILHVEDSEEHVVLMRRALERGKLKSRLTVARDGKAALELLHNLGVYADKVQYPRPDLILLDLKLPKVSGLEILEHIRHDETLKTIPVVILTASDEGADIVNAYLGGADSYFTKSIFYLGKGADPTAILETAMAMAGA